MPDKKPMEHRTYILDTLIIEKRSESDPERIVGHAAVFDTIGDGGWFREKIAPGAFSRSIQEDDIRALFNHNPDLLLGRNKAGTLALREDDKGLWVEIDPPDTQYARDLKTSIARGDISQMSFGFEILKEDREDGKDGETKLFVLQDVRLWDVSPVTFPFYQQTDVSLHSREAWSESQRERSIPVGMRLGLRRKAFNFKHKR
jgi:HK97 family phage prohead protease